MNAVHLLRRIFLESLNAGRQLHPRMTAAVVHRNLWRRKTRIRESSDSHAHSLRIAVFRVKQSGPANGTKPEDKASALITDSRVLGRSTVNLVGRRESGQRGKDTAGAALAGQAMADADSRLTLHFDP